MGSPIQRAIERLPAAELTRLTAWLVRRDQEEWDRQLIEDEAAGRFDALIAEVQADLKAGRLRGFPPTG